MKKKTLLISGGVIVVIVLIFTFTGGSSQSGDNLQADVQEGKFIVEVMTSGSLDAKNSVKIPGPKNLRTHRIWNVTIQSIIDEGTFVKKGDFVAKLDPSELTGKIQEAQLEMDQKLSRVTQTKLDTALSMREARDELINLDFAVQEKQLTLDQSQFEPPATIKKAEIELEKSKRSLKQAKENYEIKEQQSVAKMQEMSAEMSKARNDYNGLEGLAQEFTILAPEDGMLIYKKHWDGKPIKAGSQISAWDPTVATLPDLSKMISKTYVNEVDIRKVEVGQSVDIGFDAFPDKDLKGKVIKVANVGEQRPNSEAKVFLVEVEVFGTDPLLKPGMTTSNRIITKSVDDGLYIPLEALQSQYDSITFVYKTTGGSTTKQEVIIGDANAENVLVLAGLAAGDRISISSIAGMESEEVKLLEEMNGKRSKEDSSVAESSSDTGS